MTVPDPSPPPLRVRTTEIADPGPLDALLPDADGGLAWIRRGDGMVAWGEAARHKPTSITDAEEWWSDLSRGAVVESDLADGPAGSGLVAFGSFVFDPDSAAASALVVPQVVVGRRDGRAWLTQVGTTLPVVGAVPGMSRPPVAPAGLRYRHGALTPEQWTDAVSAAVGRITDGWLDKVVLARDVVAEADADLDPRWLVARLAERYPSCWTYLVDGLVGATPEMLVRRDGGLVTSRVLAGTIRRTDADGVAVGLAASLASSDKDLEEHEYAVASVAAALTPFCSGMHVPEAPYVLELPNVLHLATDVTAAARPGATALSLAAALHPTAAVCGTPTAEARRLISALEHLDRERYAGPVGWVDARGDGEWAIALRCGQLDETDRRRIRLYAGCGIVAGSDPAAELAESRAKLLPMRQALGDPAALPVR